MSFFIKTSSNDFKHSSAFVKVDPGEWKLIYQIYTKVDNSSTSWKTIYSYDWSIGNWSPCSVGCGGGTMTRSVTCKRQQDGLTVPDNFCITYGIAKPNSSTICNTNPCTTRYYFRHMLGHFQSGIISIQGINYAAQYEHQSNNFTWKYDCLALYHGAASLGIYGQYNACDGGVNCMPKFSFASGAPFCSSGLDYWDDPTLGTSTACRINHGGVRCCICRANFAYTCSGTLPDSGNQC